MADIPYTIRFSHRRTVGIHVHRDGSVEVRAPYGTPESTIRRIVAEKKDWIRDTVTRVIDEGLAEPAPANRYFDGALFPLHGGAAELMLQEIPDAGDNIVVALHPDMRRTILAVRGTNLSSERVQAAIDAWGRKYAKAYLAARVEKFAHRMGITYNRLTIRETKTRWGSCSSEGNLNLHWKLILLSERLSDYVIVHELCHRVEMNHSKSFWAQVGAVLPDYKERRKELKAIEKQILSW